MESKFIEWFKKAKPWFNSIKTQLERNAKLLKELTQQLKEQEDIIDKLIKSQKKSDLEASQKFKKIRHEFDLIKTDVERASTAINNVNKSRIISNGRK